MLYGGLFLLGGAVLLTLNYFLVRRSISVQPDVLQQRIELRLGRSLFSFQAPQSVDDEHLRQLLQQAASELRAEALHELIVQSLTALGAMAVVSVGLGWLVAGRVLRPLKKITGAARRLSEETLHERIGLHGPEDELKVLADTFDEMLDRLDGAFDSQRRFVANASHELRTPLSIIRTELDVTQSNPNPTLEEFVAMADAVRQATDRSERLIDSLLMLARGKSLNLDHQIVDLGPLALQVVADLERDALASSVRVEIATRRAEVRGDQVLLERLIQNLVENAIRYNRHGGWVEVSTAAREGEVRLIVRNSGTAIPADVVDSLFEPFRRLGPDRIRSSRGVGLGLAIVRAVAEAHGGTVAAMALAEGGLEILVELPAIAIPVGRSMEMSIPRGAS